MTVSYTYALEMYLSSVWTDVTADVRTMPITLSRGIDGSAITDRVAKVGTLTFALDNSIGNSGGKLGYYSPDNANVRAGFAIGTLIRLKITYSGTTYYKFYGKISDITPIPGQYKERYVAVQAVDYMNELLVHNMNKVAVQTNKRGEELLAAIVANLPTAPVATSYATGPDMFAYALHDIQDERSSGMNAVQRVDQSGLSYTFVRTSTVYAEILTWQSRHTRLSLSSSATFSDTMTGLIVNRKASDIYNTIKATGYPVNLGASIEVLWTSRREISIEAGTTITLDARFTDPSGAGRRVALIPGTQVTPVANTDYRMSATSGGTGSDLNGSLGITVTWGGNTASSALINNASVTGYINLLQLRGKIIRLYDPAEIVSTDAASKSSYGDRTLAYALPYQDNVNVISAFSSELLPRLKSPFSAVDELEFIANSNATLMAAAMTCDVGYMITFSETVTGFSSANYFVNSYELKLEPGKITCKLGNLEKSIAVAGETIWIWGTDASDSTMWGTNASDSGTWIF